MNTKLIIRQLGVQPYEKIWHKMQDFTDNRTEETEDEIWLVQHPSVFTQGSAGKPEHLIHQTNIPVVQSDRGGQITYHGNWSAGDVCADRHQALKSPGA